MPVEDLDKVVSGVSAHNGFGQWTKLTVLVNCEVFSLAWAELGKVNRPTMFFYLAVAVVGAKISFIKSLSIFMKRETLQKRHKQSNKHVFRVCMRSYMYITKVT